jgi:predicted nucleic acid-binding protein
VILYLDSSALVKCYVSERGSDKVLKTIAEAKAVATSATSLAEVVAAFSKAARHGLLTHEEAESAHKRFRQEWPDFVRLPITAPLLEKAADLAWSLGLRGYDSVQLAAAATWQEAMGGIVTFSTFDRHLWSAASAVGLTASPEDLPALLDSWRPAGDLDTCGAHGRS